LTGSAAVPKLPAGAGVDQATKRELLARLERDALRLCARFDLRYRVLEAERANVKRRYGVCFADGTIRIRLRHATTGRALKYSSLVNTLCHELAHLQHFNHGPRFQAFYGRILEYARGQGIYRPDAAGQGATLLAAGVLSPSSRAPSTGSRIRIHAPSTPRTLPGSPSGAPPRLPIGTTAGSTSGAMADPTAGATPAAQLELFGSVSESAKPVVRGRRR
jgi:hypothetical protein